MFEDDETTKFIKDKSHMSQMSIFCGANEKIATPNFSKDYSGSWQKEKISNGTVIVRGRYRATPQRALRVLMRYRLPARVIRPFFSKKKVVDVECEIPLQNLHLSGLKVSESYTLQSMLEYVKWVEMIGINREIVDEHILAFISPAVDILKLFFEFEVDNLPLIDERYPRDNTRYWAAVVRSANFIDACKYWLNLDGDQKISAILEKFILKLRDYLDSNEGYIKQHLLDVVDGKVQMGHALRKLALAPAAMRYYEGWDSKYLDKAWPAEIMISLSSSIATVGDIDQDVDDMIRNKLRDAVIERTRKDFHIQSDDMSESSIQTVNTEVARRLDEIMNGSINLTNMYVVAVPVLPDDIADPKASKRIHPNNSGDNSIENFSHEGKFFVIVCNTPNRVDPDKLYPLLDEKFGQNSWILVSETDECSTRYAPKLLVG